MKRGYLHRPFLIKTLSLNRLNMTNKESLQWSSGRLGSRQVLNLPPCRSHPSLEKNYAYPPSIGSINSQLCVMNPLHQCLRYLLIATVRFYQRAISPLLGSNCRFSPTCSQYMIEAIEKYGAVCGVWKGIKRIGRCHPFHKGGYDPP